MGWVDIVMATNDMCTPLVIQSRSSCQGTLRLLRLMPALSAALNRRSTRVRSTAICRA